LQRSEAKLVAVTDSVKNRVAPGAAFAEKSVEADGCRIRYCEAGHGDVLLAFHGGGGIRLSGTHDILAERYRILAFEVPGFGESPVNAGLTSLRDVAALMHKAVASLGIARYSIMANAFTAKLGLWLAIDQPDAVEALVLVAPSAIKPEDLQRPKATTDAERLALLHAHPERLPPSKPVAPEIDAKQRAIVERLSGPKREAALEAAMAGIKTPVMAVFGTKDRLNPPEVAHLYREIMPSCHLMMIYDAAHSVDADRPEALAAVVGDFLKLRDRFLVNYESSVLYP
jgi:pimeloyl-ACP methyl ester carboxylesterase